MLVERTEMKVRLNKLLWVIRDYIYVKVYVFVKRVPIILAQFTARFQKIEKNKIVFNHFNGKPYGDNPGKIADEILKQKLNWDLVWLARDTSIALPDGVRAVPHGTAEAIRERATAKVWIDNVRNDIRPAKKRGQICLQTWHGSVNFKHVEAAAEHLNKKYVRMAREDGRNCDGIISGSGLRSIDYRDNFWLNPKTEILEFGLPRNDLLFCEAEVQNRGEKIRARLHIENDCKIVLYMPTFRDDQSVEGYALDYQGTVCAFEQRFQQKFVMLVRLHHNVTEHIQMIPFGKNIIDVSYFPDAQELYMAADYLITDYSSAAFDFSLLKRPVFLCALDYEKYLQLRGLSETFYNCPFPHTYRSEELIEAILLFDEKEYWEKFEAFRKIWQSFDDGHAAQRTVEWLKKRMEK